jgi:molybdenum cofactor synthesis domain-containing protein
MTQNKKQLRAAIIIASDRCSRAEAQDLTGPALQYFLTGNGWHVTGVRIVPDDIKQLSAAIAEPADSSAADLILIAGGTGLGPRDVTPEATRPLLDKELPGIGECMRAAHRAKNPRADLSRAIAGTRKMSLIINLPGSPAGAQESLSSVLQLAGHALAMLSGEGHQHA